MMKVRNRAPVTVKAVLFYLSLAGVISLIWLYTILPKKLDREDLSLGTDVTEEEAIEERHRALRLQDEILQTVRQSCKIPRLKPFERTILQTMETESESNWALDCGRERIFSVDSDWRLIRHKAEDWDCCYRRFYPVLFPPSSSYSNIFTYSHVDPTLLASFSSTCTRIYSDVTKIPRNYEFISVECWSSSSETDSTDATEGSTTTTRMNTNGSTPADDIGRAVFRDMFAFVPVKWEKEVLVETSSKRPPDVRPSVLIIGIDQVSHMQFIRHFPKSYDFLTNVLKAVSFFGYNKVGTTTIPNVVPLLTGLDLEELRTSCWNHSFLSFFDSCPFIWQNFSRAGYLTSYGEDKLPFSIFYNKLYARRGFRWQPTDYFYNLAGMQMNTKIRSRFACINHRLQFTDLLDYVERTGVSLRGKPYFQFVWASSLFTKEYRLARNGDLPLVGTLKRLLEKKLLENTIVFILSDHGYRFSPLIELHQGRFESKLPAFFAFIPSGFAQKFPSATRNFERNIFRLTSPFDVHATLEDLLDPVGNLGNDKIAQRTFVRNDGSMQRGISLFLPIPLNRTCADAGVDDGFCSCRETKPLKFLYASNVIDKFAEKILDEINSQLENETKCEKLSLANGFIPRAEVVLPEGDPRGPLSESRKYFILQEGPDYFGGSGWTEKPDSAVVTNMGNFTEVLITVQMIPGRGIFEGRLKLIDGEWRVMDVVRLNAYKKQSHCVYLYKLKSICYCKVQIYFD